VGLFQKAYETYEYHKSLTGKFFSNKTPLLPLSHVMKDVQIEIVINSAGDFCSAKRLEKPKKGGDKEYSVDTIIPTTVESGSRTSSKIAPYPLCDNLSYLRVGSEKFEQFIKQLSNWETSVYGDEKLTAVRKYLEKGSITKDLETNGISNYKDGDFIRWRILGTKNNEECWKDNNLFRKWTDYYQNIVEQEYDNGLCMITGDIVNLASSTPKKIYKGFANAKLVSANDSNNFVFRGRFKTSEQASSVGYLAFQKVYVILQWLASNDSTSFRIGNRIAIIWNPKGKAVMDIVKSPFCNRNKSIFTPSDYREELKYSFSGFRNELPATEDVVIAALDAATTGRLSVVYYNELKASDFLDRINHWYDSCYWYYYKNVQSPTLYNIVKFAFGNQLGNKDDSKVEVDDKVLKLHMQRLFTCMIEMAPIPYDIVLALTTKASMPLCYNNNNREAILSVACAIIRKYYNDKANKEEWTMSLDKHNINRSYLFGRLLAVMEQVERATYSYEEKREPNAIRLQSAFCARPYNTMKIIYDRLLPYFAQLYPGSRQKYKNLIGEIMEKLDDVDDVIKNRPLESQYLMGYFLQRNELLKSNKKQEEDIENGNVEQED